MSEHATSPKQSEVSSSPSSTRDPAPKSKQENRYQSVKMPERIIGTRVENGKTRILIATGAQRGVVVGMKGALIARGNTRFVIDRVSDRSCSAPIDVPPETLLEVAHPLVWIFPQGNKS
jgi:hypothetical protein